MRDRLFHYVNFHRIDDFLCCGWVVVIPKGLPVLSDLYGVSMEWLCDCKMPRPQ